MICENVLYLLGCSSAGRALPLQGKDSGSNPLILQNLKREFVKYPKAIPESLL